MTNTREQLIDLAQDLSTEHLTRTLFTEAGRMMHTVAELDAYRDELFARRSA